MTPIDDSNTNDSENTPPGYWFGELNARLRDRMRDELHELDLGWRGWRILHTLAAGPATADELAAALPHRGRRGRGRAFGTGPEDARLAGARAADGDADAQQRTDAASAPREWRGHPDWMRREWERRQQMYRAWMEHDSARAQSGPGGRTAGRLSAASAPPPPRRGSPGRAGPEHASSPPPPGLDRGHLRAPTAVPARHAAVPPRPRPGPVASASPARPAAGRTRRRP